MRGFTSEGEGAKVRRLHGAPESPSLGIEREDEGLRPRLDGLSALLENHKMIKNSNLNGNKGA